MEVSEISYLKIEIAYERLEGIKESIHKVTAGTDSIYIKCFWIQRIKN